ncbi:hypothetical protein [Lewinella cohaerens]|uniref:hypothetical protein n=1 Tax=Lewinella cohaerens TaxID=70995 RepID=UPI000368E2A9|nr:hypothetical protein [Lewinella cohaerens]
MNTLIVTIKLLIGFYTVSIQGNFIVVAYYSNELTEEPDIISVLDMDTEKSFKFEGDSIVSMVALLETNKEKTMRLLDTPVPRGAETLLDYECEIYSQSHEMTNYLNNQGKAVLQSQVYMSDVPLLRKYLHNENIIKFIPYFGTDSFTEFNKFRLKLEETTHHSPILIFEIIGIEEVINLHPKIVSAISRVKQKTASIGN